MGLIYFLHKQTHALKHRHKHKHTQIHTPIRINTISNPSTSTSIYSLNYLLILQYMKPFRFQQASDSWPAVGLYCIALVILTLAPPQHKHFSFSQYFRSYPPFSTNTHTHTHTHDSSLYLLSSHRTDVAHPADHPRPRTDGK